MALLYCDLETYSEAPLKTCGTTNYAQHPSTEVTLFSYALDEEPVELWDRTAGEAMPTKLEDALFDERIPTVWHNSMFDRTVLNNTDTVPGMILTPARIIDTMVQALAHGLPGGLDKLGELFGLSEADAKMKEGRALIHFFCKPVKGVRHTRLTHPDRWETFRQYAKSDITAMRIIHKKLPKWNYPGSNFPTEPSSEHRVWCLDQRINDRGFAVDLELAHSAIAAATIEKKRRDAAVQDLTDGEVSAATQRDKLLKHILEAHGVSLPDMKADTLKRRVDDPDLPLAVRQLIDLRMQSSRNSASKYTAVVNNVANDGRLHGTTQFCGAAATGRWGGRVFQPQNMMRPTMKAHDIIEAIELVKLGLLPLFFANVAEVLGNCVRGAIIAPEGKKIIVSDLSSIEGRGLAWLANEEEVLAFYRGVDSGVYNYDAYMKAYADVFGGDPWDVTKAQRTVGKPIELAFGYGGGVAAFLTFAITYGLDLDYLSELVWDNGELAHLRECEGKFEWAKKHNYHGGMGKRKFAAFEYVKQRWRTARPMTVAFWEALDQGFKMACAYEGKQFHAGPVIFLRKGQWMRMRLPSGRCITFLQPQADENGITFRGLDRYSHRFGRVMTHGGKLSGIVTQAFASDILREIITDLEADDMPVILTIHDEALCEVPDTDAFSLARMNTHMTRERSWAKGLPLAAEGFETYRYRKE